MALLASPDVGVRRRALLKKPFASPGSFDARLPTWQGSTMELAGTQRHRRESPRGVANRKMSESINGAHHKPLTMHMRSVVEALAAAST